VRGFWPELETPSPHLLSRGVIIPFIWRTQSATCDILTQGRLDLCLCGRWGSRFGRFFGHGDINSEESRERVAEAIALIKLAWTQERVRFQGKYWQADNLPVLPQPVQQPHPPLLLASNSNDTFPYAARLGLGAVCTTLSRPMPRLIDRLAEYAAAKPVNGMTLPPRVYAMVSFCVAKTRVEAHAVACENWRDTDTAHGAAFMKSLGLDASRPDFTTGAAGFRAPGYGHRCGSSPSRSCQSCAMSLQPVRAAAHTVMVRLDGKSQQTDLHEAFTPGPP
jgi:alkanesulfonate monooxygenase SsuD/methylene tetrahydromethanopterin reductase-like flavin-dependent oxidoreductase (luciferase family)